MRTTASTTVAVDTQTQTQIDSFTFLRQQIVAGSLGNRTKVKKVKKRRKEELVVKYTDWLTGAADTVGGDVIVAVVMVKILLLLRMTRRRVQELHLTFAAQHTAHTHRWSLKEHCRGRWKCSRSTKFWWLWWWWLWPWRRRRKSQNIKDR